MANPQENTKVRLLVKFYNRRCHVVPADTKLISMLKYFQTGRSHIALVQEVQQRPHGDPYYEVKGLITMEDVIEELIQSEIFDEYDAVPSANAANSGTTFSTVGALTFAKKQIGLTSRCSRRIHLNCNELKASALFLCESLP
uniref:Metal transporter CNNM4 n=1 Tax=Lygus hesperus TaxID=30085 RepID=A0A146LXJ7_LYGHE